jgi:hypothetical protein
MYRIADEPFVRTKEPLDMSHYDLTETDGGIIVWCVDGRFHKRGNSLLHAFLEKKGWEYYDLIIEPGAIRVLASHDPKDAAERGSLIYRLRKSKEFHAAKGGSYGTNVVLADHDDCGGYGYRKVFNDLNAQFRRFVLDLESAKRAFLQEIDPTANVELYVAKGNGGLYPLMEAA